MFDSVLTTGPNYINDSILSGNQEIASWPGQKTECVCVLSFSCVHSFVFATILILSRTLPWMFFIHAHLHTLVKNKLMQSRSRRTRHWRTSWVLSQAHPFVHTGIIYCYVFKSGFLSRSQSALISNTFFFFFSFLVGTNSNWGGVSISRTNAADSHFTKHVIKFVLVKRTNLSVIQTWSWCGKHAASA